MKITKSVLACVAVLAFVALSTRPAHAGDVDCTTGVTACFGTTIVGTASGLLAGNGHAASFAETVYKQGSVYTYVFTITNDNTAALDFANTFTSASGGGFGDNFNCGNGSCLNYGVVTGVGFTTAGKDDTGFSFNSLSLQVGFTSLSSQQQFTFYVQGGPTASGKIYVGNSGATGQDNSLDPASEPGILILLGSLLGLLLLGLPFAPRLRAAIA